MILRNRSQLIKLAMTQDCLSLISLICWVIKIHTAIHNSLVRIFGIAVWRIGMLASIIIPSLNFFISIYHPWDCTPFISLPWSLNNFTLIWVVSLLFISVGFEKKAFAVFVLSRFCFMLEILSLSESTH